VFRRRESRVAGGRLGRAAEGRAADVAEATARLRRSTAGRAGRAQAVAAFPAEARVVAILSRAARTLYQQDLQGGLSLAAAVPPVNRPLLPPGSASRRLQASVLRSDEGAGARPAAAAVAVVEDDADALR
jgi:hypothetical protein